MAYVDAMVGAVPKANREIYRIHAEHAARIFEEHGALGLVECWGDDVPDGKVTSLPMAVRKADDEDVVFSFILWPTRDVRDAAMPRIMADPRMDKAPLSPMPFDGQRMIFGGFQVLLERWRGSDASLVQMLERI